MGFSSSNSLFLSYITTFSATRYLLIKLDNFLAPYLDAYNDVLSSLSSIVMIIRKIVIVNHSELEE